MGPSFLHIAIWGLSMNDLTDRNIAFVVSLPTPITFTWKKEKYQWLAIYLNKSGNQIGGLVLSSRNEILPFEPEVFTKFELDPALLLDKEKIKQKVIEKINSNFVGRVSVKKEDTSGNLF